MSLKKMNGFNIIPIVFLGATIIITVLSWLLPIFKKKPLLSKMLCSSMFLLTGISSAICTGLYFLGAIAILSVTMLSISFM